MWVKQTRVKCKNCLHVDVCDGMYFNLDKDCERDCGYFKERSKYAEVTQTDKIDFDYGAED